MLGGLTDPSSEATTAGGWLLSIFLGPASFHAVSEELREEVDRGFLAEDETHVKFVCRPSARPGLPLCPKSALMQVAVG